VQSIRARNPSQQRASQSYLPPIEAAGEGTTLRWFEHYDRADPILDEVFITEKGKADWKSYAQDKDVAKAWEQLTGEAIPDFAANAGSIDANGNYTAPATLTSAQVAVIVATLQDEVTNNTLAATALVYLEPSVDDWTTPKKPGGAAQTATTTVLCHTRSSNFLFVMFCSGR
jgi:hypothetical protein